MTVHRALSRLLVLPIVCLGPMFLTGLATAAEGHLTRLPLKSAAIAVAFSPDGRYLAAGSHDGTVYLWEMPPKAEKAVCLRQHTCRVSAVCFAPAGRCLASGSWDGSIALWDPSSDKPRRVVRVGGRVTSLAVSPDGKILAIGLLPPMGDLGQRGEVQVRSLEDGRLLRRLEEEDLEREGNATHVSVAFVPGSPWLAAGYNLHWQLGDCVQTVGVVRLRDPATGSRSPTCPMTSLHRAGLYGLHALAVCPLGRLLALAEGQPDPEEPLPNSWEDPVVDSRVSLWDANRGTLHRNLPLWLDEKGRLQDLDALRCLAYSSDGFFLCAGARSGSLYLWEVHTGEPLIEFDPVEQLHDYSRGTEALSLAFSPDARFLAFCRGKLVVLSDLSPKDWGPFRPEERDPEEYQKRLLRWRALRGKNGSAAYRAMWDLAAAPQTTEAWLREQWCPEPKADERLRSLIATLDDSSFSRRDEADRELRWSCPRILPDLQRALKAKLSLEARRRIERIVGDWGDERTLAEEDKRFLPRAIWVLQRQGTAGSRRLLEYLARAAPHEWTVTYAIAAQGLPMNNVHVTSILVNPEAAPLIGKAPQGFMVGPWTFPADAKPSAPKTFPWANRLKSTLGPGLPAFPGAVKGPKYDWDGDPTIPCKPTDALVGQNNPNPYATFYNHLVVTISSSKPSCTIHDPSCGKKYTADSRTASLAAFQDQAISGFFVMQGMTMQIRKQTDATPKGQNLVLKTETVPGF